MELTTRGRESVDEAVQGNDDEQVDQEMKNEYMLAIDRQRRQIILPHNYASDDVVSFALNTASEIDTLEQRTHTEAVWSKDEKK